MTEEREPYKTERRRTIRVDAEEYAAMEAVIEAVRMVSLNHVCFCFTCLKEMAALAKLDAVRNRKPSDLEE